MNKDKLFRKALVSLNLSVPKTVNTYADFIKLCDSKEIDLQSNKDTLEQIREAIPNARKNLEIIKTNIDTLKERLNNDGLTKIQRQDIKDKITDFEDLNGDNQDFLIGAADYIKQCEKNIEICEGNLDLMTRIEDEMTILHFRRLNPQLKKAYVSKM